MFIFISSFTCSINRFRISRQRVNWNGSRFVNDDCLSSYFFFILSLSLHLSLVDTGLVWYDKLFEDDRISVLYVIVQPMWWDDEQGDTSASPRSCSFLSHRSLVQLVDFEFRAREQIGMALCLWAMIVFLAISFLSLSLPCQYRSYLVW